MSTRQIIKLNLHLQQAKENFRENFGGLDIIFAGDFSQLKPIISSNDYNNGSLYTAKGRAYELWQGSINCFIELKGMHRFKNDPEWGLILKRMREGIPTKNDLKEINRHVVNNDTK